jgi:DNA-binding Lrp family transcriptional regulator
MVTQAPNIDKKDLLILTCLREKPDLTIKQLAEEIEAIVGPNEAIPYPTLQKRVQNLINEGVLSRQMSVDLSAFNFSLHCRIDIFINPSELRHKPKPHGAKTQKALAEYIMNTLATNETYKDDIFIKDVHILLGTDADLAIDIFAKDYQKITEFVTEGLRDLPGIGNTRTALLTWSVKHGNL